METEEERMGNEMKVYKCYVTYNYVEEQEVFLLNGWLEMKMMRMMEKVLSVGVHQIVVIATGCINMLGFENVDTIYQFSFFIYNYVFKTKNYIYT